MAKPGRRTLDLDNASVLLDVVFGVVIGLALIELPPVIADAVETRSYSSSTSALLLSSALVFSAFYWIEVKQFIYRQERFNEAIQDAEAIERDEVPLDLALFLLGSLIMMTLATGTLVFAAKGAFQAFLIANALFWICDLFGSVGLKASYRHFREAIESERIQRIHDYDWFDGHIVSGFFYVYGAVNFSFYVLLVLGDLLIGGLLYRLLVAIAVLAFTAFRHLVWRAFGYRWWLNRKSQLRESASQHVE